MANLDQVIQQIRFGFEQLSVRNAQHPFEALCRHYARERICSNILPATGPVAAGGDQGRDCETFRTYLSRSSLRDSAFLGLVSEGAVAFAFTTKQPPVDQKVKSDVKTIMRGAVTPHSIHFMCTADIPVSKRHRLQQWASANHKVHLEIHDGGALSEGIAQKDLFWLAVKYLEVPSELYPREFLPDDATYETAIARWRSQAVDTKSYGDFCELKSFIRHATWQERAKPDLPFWILKMEEFLGADPRDTLARRARYEVTVATLRGHGSLVGHEASVLPYFQQVIDQTSLQELEDVTLLLHYCITATLFGNACFSLTELKRIQEIIIRALDEQLKTRGDPSALARLLLLRSYPATHVFTEKAVDASIERQLPWWLKILPHLPKARLFSVESFSEILTIASGHLGPRPELEELTAAVDRELTQRVGGFAAAEQSVKRGMAHYEHERLLAAIGEIQKARINWFAEETLIHFCRSLLLLSAWYQSLGLCLAAKYHALAASFVAVRAGDQVREVTWRGLLRAASCDYSIGAWASFLDLTELGIAAHNRLAREPGNFEKHEELDAVLLHSCASVAVTERLRPRHARWIATRVADLRVVSPAEIDVARTGLANLSDTAFEATVREQLWSLPITDVDVTRSVSWSALGIEWTVAWPNLYRTTVLGEQLVAVLQILQAELARHDLCVPSARVILHFDLGSITTYSIAPEIAEGKRDFQWRITWPRESDWFDVDSVLRSTLSLCFNIIENASLLPRATLERLFEDIFKRGIPARALIGQTYAIVYSDIVIDDMFNKGRQTLALPEELKPERPLKCHTELLAATGPGYGYSRELSLKHIEARYEKIISLIPYTLQRLRQSAAFRQVVQTLRAKQWKDWHILSAVFNLVVNYRSRLECCDPTDRKEMSDYMRHCMSEKETDESPVVPVEELTEDNLNTQRIVHLGAVLTTWGLEFRHPALPVSVIQDFLATRYAYWIDDVDHPDIFGV